MPNDLILLVDDELSIIQLSQMYLSREGYRLDSVRDGESALSAVERLHPALVVLDVMLPKLDGFEVCRRLRASQTDTAILMLTARDEDIDKNLGLELGADDYVEIEVPVRPDRGPVGAGVLRFVYLLEANENVVRIGWVDVEELGVPSLYAGPIEDRILEGGSFDASSPGLAILFQGPAGLPLGETNTPARAVWNEWLYCVIDSTSA